MTKPLRCGPMGCGRVSMPGRSACEVGEGKGLCLGGPPYLVTWGACVHPNTHTHMVVRWRVVVVVFVVYCVVVYVVCVKGGIRGTSVNGGALAPHLPRGYVVCTWV